MRLQIVRRLVVEQVEIDVVTAEFLHRADTMDILRQGRIGRGAGLPRPQEGSARPRQPDDADQEQHRHHRQGHQPELHVEAEHHRDDADQQDQIADGEDRGFEKFLQRRDVALQPGHQAADFCPIHEAEGDELQMFEHRPPQVEQQMAGDPADRGFHHMVGDIIDRDHAGEDGDEDMQQRGLAAVGQRFIDHRPHDQRDRQLREGEQQHHANRQDHAFLVGRQKVHEAAYHPFVEDLAEQLLVLRDLGADDSQGRPFLDAISPRHGHPPTAGGIAGRKVPDNGRPIPSVHHGCPARRCGRRRGTGSRPPASGS